MTVLARRHKRTRGTGRARPARRKYTVLGLLGGVGSGKSTVAGMLAGFGAVVLDADAICSALHRTAAVRRAIRARWGPGVFLPTGELDRARLAARVFSRPRELAVLNAIVHPRVLRLVRRHVAAWRKSGGGLCVIDAPLVIESGLDDLCDGLVFVQCDRATRARRLAAARNWTRAELLRREACQRPLAEKRRRADFVIVNRGSVAAVRTQVKRILATLNSIGEK